MAVASSNDVLFLQLAELVLQSDFKQVRLLATPQLVKSADETRRTVLMMAADARETPVKAEKCISYLFELGADPAWSDEAGDTAAHVAARRDNLRLLALLPFDAKWLRNKRSMTPLMEAAQNGSWRCTKHLLHLLRQRRYNKNKNSRVLLKLKDLDGRMASDLARQNGHTELANDVDRAMRLVLSDVGRISGLTEFEEAERKHLEDLAKAGNTRDLLLTVNRVNCDLPDAYGQSVLMWASRSSACSEAALWQQLLKLCDPTYADVYACSSLHLAAGCGNLIALEALLSAGASANAKNEYEFTPLMWAAREAPHATAAAVGQALLTAGSNWSLKNYMGRTALDLALEKGKHDLAELLRACEGRNFYFASPEVPSVEFHQQDSPVTESSSDPEENSAEAPFLERWSNVQLIGRGGFGEVHEVLTDKGLRCAAKTLRLPVQRGDQLDPSKKNELDRAVKGEINLCRLHHENIVKFLHITQTEFATVVLFMELLEGETLERVINGKPLEECSVREFTEQIGSALLYLHSQEPPVIHRDINCNNTMLLKANGKIKLIDFGLSIKLEQSISYLSTSAATPKGTLNFLAPELLAPDDAGYPRYGKESDIWAFGCLVYQMVTGSKPYGAVSNLLQLARFIDQRGAPELPNSCSAELRHFYGRCTALDSKKRDTMAQLMSHQFITAARPVETESNTDKGFSC